MNRIPRSQRPGGYITTESWTMWNISHGPCTCALADKKAGILPLRLCAGRSVKKARQFFGIAGPFWAPGGFTWVQPEGNHSTFRNETGPGVIRSLRAEQFVLYALVKCPRQSRRVKTFASGGSAKREEMNNFTIARKIILDKRCPFTGQGSDASGGFFSAS